MELIGYSDADHAGCLDTRRSTTGFVMLLCGTPIIWRSTKQTITADSTCVAEYVAASTAAKELVWARSFLGELGIKLNASTLYVDNQGAISLIKNFQVNAKTKHLDIKLHMVRDYISEKQISVEYISTDKNLADLFTKALPKERFQRLARDICSSGNVVDHCCLVEEEKRSKIMISTKAVIAVAVLLAHVACLPSQSFLLSNEYQIISYKRFVTTRSPCELVFTNPKVAKERGQACASRIMREYDYCTERYHRLFDLMTGMGRLRIAKRSVIEEATGLVSGGIYSIASAATSWAVGLVSNSLDNALLQVASKLGVALVKKLQESYANRSLVPTDFVRSDIEEVSEFAASRPSHLRQAVYMVPYEDSFFKYMHQEMSAAEVLLLSIEEEAKRGKMDTQALGEIIDEPRLKGIDPNSTRLIKISSFPMDHSVEFAFEQIIKFGFFERIIVQNLLMLLGFLLVLVTSVAVLFYYCTKKWQPSLEPTYATPSSPLPPVPRGVVVLEDYVSNRSQSCSSGNVEVAYAAHSSGGRAGVATIYSRG